MTGMLLSHAGENRRDTVAAMLPPLSARRLNRRRIAYARPVAPLDYTPGEAVRA